MTKQKIIRVSASRTTEATKVLQSHLNTGWVVKMVTVLADADGGECADYILKKKFDESR